MISIIEHIEYLVLRHDCVVIPGLGALIAHHTPARFDAELGCVFPPRRSMTFNPELTHNDGLLVNSVARRHMLTYDQAVQVVMDCVNAMRYQLRQEGETGIGHLGVLSLSEDGVPSFEPFESASIAPRYFGLCAVKAVPLSLRQQSRASVAETVQPDTATTMAETHVSVTRNVMQIAAAMVALVMLGLMLSTPIIDSRAIRASMAPAIERVTQPADTLTDLIAASWNGENINDISLVIAMPDSLKGTAYVSSQTSSYRKNESAQYITRCDASDPYFLIVASLPSAYKASEYIAEHPYGNEMHLLECDGRYRIYVATGKTFAAAQRPMLSAGFSERYPQAWVCRP